MSTTVHASHYCRCGCTKTVKPSRRYRQGHDAKHVADLVGRWNAARNAGDRELMRAIDVLADMNMSRKLYAQFRARTVESGAER